MENTATSLLSYWETATVIKHIHLFLKHQETPTALAQRDL